MNPEVKHWRRLLARVGFMDARAETLDARLREWKPETAAEVPERVTEIIGLADQNIPDLLRSRSLEQDVLDILDKPASR